MASIEQRGPNSWRITVFAGRDATGKQLRRRLSFTGTEREAEKAAAKFEAEVLRGDALGATGYTLAAFVNEMWLPNYAETNLAARTLARYKEILSTRILPFLGHIKLEKLRPTHILEFHAYLRQEDNKRVWQPGKLSDQTILHHHRVLSAVLTHAVEWQLLASNPAMKVRRPRVKKRKAPYLDESQTAALLLALDSEPETFFKFKMLILLALSSGLRRGELMGLEWKHVNFDHSTVDVQQSSQYVPDVGVITKSPKNESSERVVTLPESVMALLKKYKAYQAAERLKVGDRWQGSDRLFVTWDGAPMHPDSISNWFRKFLKRHELPLIPFHSLRHTSATLLIAQNVPTKTVSARLGHSTISITMDIYAHALRSADAAAAEKLDPLRILQSGQVAKR